MAPSRPFVTGSFGSSAGGASVGLALAVIASLLGASPTAVAQQ